MNGPIATSILGLAYFGLYYMFAKRAEVVLIDKLDKQYPAERKKKAAATLQQDTDTVVCKNIRRKKLKIKFKHFLMNSSYFLACFKSDPIKNDSVKTNYTTIKWMLSNFQGY